MDIESKRAIGRRIRIIRDAKGLTQAQLGLMTGINSTYLSGLENGRRNPSLGTFSKIAEGLDVPIEELFRDPGAPLPL